MEGHDKYVRDMITKSPEQQTIDALVAALEPFAQLWTCPEIGRIERESDVVLEGEGGRVRPKFNMMKALKRADAALALARKVSP